MVWIIFAILTALGLTLANFCDNYIVDTALKRRNPAALQLTYTISKVLIILILFGFFSGAIFSSSVLNIGILVFMGIINNLGNIPWYHALSSDDTFDATIFYQVRPILSLIFGAIFLQQAISGNHAIALVFIILAIMVLIFYTHSPRGSNKVNIRSALLVTCASLCWVAANIVFVAIVNQDLTPEHFGSSLAWFEFGVIVGNVILALIHRRWLHELRVALTGPHIKKLFVVIGSNILATFASIFTRIGLVLAPALVIMEVTTSVLQLFNTFVLGVILTAIWPVFGREKLNKRVILAHLVAVILASAGIILLNT